MRAASGPAAEIYGRLLLLSFCRGVSAALHVEFLSEIGYHDTQDDRLLFCDRASCGAPPRTTPVNADSAK
jgi:hypothetical protein